MGIVKVFAGVESGRPWLEFRNDRNEAVLIKQVLFMRGYAPAGSCSCYRPTQPFRIEPGRSRRTVSKESDDLGTELNKMFQEGEAETVIRIGLDLDPEQADHDQPPPSFYVVRARDGQFIEFFSLSDSLEGEPSLLDVLVKSHRPGA